MHQNKDQRKQREDEVKHKMMHATREISDVTSKMYKNEALQKK